MKKLNIWKNNFIKRAGRQKLYDFKTPGILKEVFNLDVGMDFAKEILTKNINNNDKNKNKIIELFIISQREMKKYLKMIKQTIMKRNIYKQKK